MRHEIPKSIKEKLVKGPGGKCPVCGVMNVPLQVVHILPMSRGGTNSAENLTLLCANCHRSIDRASFSEIEFVRYLCELLEANPVFVDVVTEARVSDKSYIRADIATKSTQDKKSILVECKNTDALTGDRLRSGISQIRYYKQVSEFDRYVLAIPGRISVEGKKQVDEAGIEVWDADHIVKTFRAEIEKSTHLYFRSLFLSLAPLVSLPTEHRLLKKLESCQPGKKSWSEYQRLVGQILQHMFCPPLGSPISESVDKFSINRRDWIFPNYSDQGFWRFLRETYKADYIVVDAKNYKKPISKNQVLQISNYLKSHGPGLFAIIATRCGVDRGAELTIREQWMVHNKMILVIDDTDLEEMLLASSVGGKPYKVLGRVIESFRLSI